MSFKAAKCPNCAGELQVPDDRDTVKCMYCGSDIVVRTAIQAAAGGINIENLLKLAKDSEEAGLFKEAYSYSSKVLEYDSNNEEANLGKYLCHLVDYNDDFSFYQNFNTSKNKFLDLLNLSNNKADFKKGLAERLANSISTKFPLLSTLKNQYLVVAQVNDPPAHIFSFIHDHLDETNINGLLAKGRFEVSKNLPVAIEYFGKAIDRAGSNKNLIIDSIIQIGIFHFIQSECRREAKDVNSFMRVATPWFDYINKIAPNDTQTERWIIMQFPWSLTGKYELYFFLLNRVNAIDPEFKGLGYKKKSSCFIATATYGSPVASEVVLLRNFRDECLSTNSLGNAFINTYYRISPPIAEIISKSDILKAIFRQILRPVIFGVKLFHKGHNA